MSHKIQFIILILLLGKSIMAQAVCKDLSIQNDWNLVSVPLLTDNMMVSNLFPTAAGSAYSYNNGYFVENLLSNSKGYWIKFNSAQTVQICGTKVISNTVNVKSGWNIIGPFDKDIITSEITSTPTPIISSNFYGFNNGYSIATTLIAGKGYWVKVSQNGTLTVPNYIAAPCQGTPTVTYAGRVYNTVMIGSQCWLKENLSVGTMIDSMLNQTNNGFIEKYCINNDTNMCNTYGGFYQWNEAMQYVTIVATKGICPLGWHIPTMAEYDTLGDFVNHDGNALKAIGQGTNEGGWTGAGTNITGFSALLSGDRHYGGGFEDLTFVSHQWTSSQLGTSSASYHVLWYNNNNLVVGNDLKTYGFNVRCIKD